ncbi:MAG: oligosaccharide flippase family protein [Bacteroidia bacterium]
MKKLWMSEFGKSVATLVSGSLVAQILGIISILTLPRLYDDVHFGFFGFFVATVAIVVVVINGGYEHAIMLPDEEPVSRSLTALSLWIAVAGSGLVLLVLVLWGKAILRLGDVAGLYGWHYAIPLSILLEGISQPFRTLLNRNESYRLLSFSKIARALVLVIVSVVLGLKNMGFAGLIAGYIAGQVAGFGVLLAGLKKDHWSFDTWLRWKNLKHAGSQFIDFPRYSVASAWLNTASKHLPYYLLIPMFDAGVAGQFGQADRVLTLPVVLISMSVGTVYFQHASRAFQESGAALSKITIQTFIRLLIPAIPFLLITMIWGPSLFAWVLGEEWRTAGVYARWMMPWMFMVFMASPLSYLIDIRRKLREFLWYNIGLFSVRLAALWVGGRYFSAEEAMMIYGFSGMAMVGLQLGYLLYIGGVWGRKDIA